jgi:hypothetical protein
MHRLRSKLSVFVSTPVKVTYNNKGHNLLHNLRIIYVHYESVMFYSIGPWSLQVKGNFGIPTVFYIFSKHYVIFTVEFLNFIFNCRTLYGTGTGVIVIKRFSSSHVLLFKHISYSNYKIVKN